MSPIKILHICTGFNLDFNGGITNYVRCIAKQQVENGYKVYVLSGGGNSNGYTVIDFNSKIPEWSYYKRNDSKSLKFVKEVIEKYDFDLIHIHMMLNMDQRIYSLLKGRKYVISLHDYYFLCPRIQMIPPVGERCESAGVAKCKKCFSVIEKNWFLYRVCCKLFNGETAYKFPIKSKKVIKKWFDSNKQLLENAQMLFPVSKRVEEIYKNSGIKNDYKVLHIGNISALDFGKYKESEPHDKIKLVLLSNVSRIKGGPLFFDLLKKVTNPFIEVHFYGRCSPSEKKIFKELGIINHGIYKQVDLSLILSEMDMGVVTPIWEDNGPQVVMEMLNNRLPVFATRMGGITDFVNDENGYLFNPYVAEEVSNAINFLNKLTHEKITLMRGAIKRTNTPAEHYNELSLCYEKILNSNR